MAEERAVVFVVDDDVAMRDSLEKLLRSVDLDVRSFGSAREFLQAKRLDAPGCLVLDVRLPGDQPTRLTELNHGDQGGGVLEGGERPAQIVLLGHFRVCLQ